jgi:RNA 2',3'-cyclic 3'-phosphodiesterase
LTRDTAEGGVVRAFLALPLDAAALDRVAETVGTLKPGIAGIRWVRPEGLHLTLRFLGPSSPGALARMEPALRSAAAACPATVARLSGLGVFPERGSPRVLWLGCALDHEVLVLQEACERAAIDAGFAPEGRAFRAHLTLGRWRDRASRPSLPDVDLGETALDRLVLFRSDLRSTGAVYTPLGVFPLSRL